MAHHTIDHHRIAMLEIKYIADQGVRCKQRESVSFRTKLLNIGRVPTIEPTRLIDVDQLDDHLKQLQDTETKKYANTIKVIINQSEHDQTMSNFRDIFKLPHHIRQASYGTMLQNLKSIPIFALINNIGRCVLKNVEIRLFIYSETSELKYTIQTPEWLEPFEYDENEGLYISKTPYMNGIAYHTESITVTPEINKCQIFINCLECLFKYTC